MARTTPRAAENPDTETSTRLGAELLDHWEVLVERRRVVLVTLAAVFLVTTLLTFTATPLYRATTTLEIDRQSPEILEFTDVVNVDPAGYRDFYQTQYKILQSRAVLLGAVERLDLFNRPEYAGRSLPPARRIVAWVKERAGVSRRQDPLAQALRFLEDGLSITPVRQSYLVEVEFLDQDPQLAADIANSVAEAYQQFQLDTRYGVTGQAKEWLTKDVARVRAEVDELERRLQSYGERKGLLSMGEGLRDISEQALADLNTAYTAARGRLASTEARFSALQSADPRGLAEVQRSATVAELRQQIAGLEQRHAKIAERFQRDWPPRVELERQLNLAREQLAREVAEIAVRVRSATRTDFERARSEVTHLEQERDRQKLEVQRVNREAIEYASLEAEIGAKRKVLNDLIARQSETDASYRLREARASNVRVVDIAQPPPRPVRPRKTTNLVLALVLGSMLGVGLALAVHQLDDTLKSEDDVKRLTPLAVLGHIPLTQSERPTNGPLSFDTQQLDLASHIGPRTSFAENFRSLRTSLLLASADHPPRQVTITSCEPGEGKSTVALNLAIVLTQLGRRVLLVDADLRRPRLHKSLDLANDLGLSSYLSGNAPAESLPQETDVPGLLAITSGPVPPNPSELLGSPALQTLTDRLVADYGFDHIVFDSPPVLSVTDAIILASCTDATMLLVRAGRTRRDALLRSFARLRQARAHLAGVVVNAIAQNKTTRYQYYYSSYGQGADDRGATPGDGPVPAPRRAGRRRRAG